jgi:polysaccharide deacetylase family protein (PEP-CTERM system associated)
MKNALTVDVEDWFQVSNFARLVRRSEWDNFPSRVVQNTRRLLDLFDEYRTRATFFVLGWTAERFPELVQEIITRGHDLGSHGYSHDLVHELGVVDFAKDLRRSLDLIEQAGGVRPKGYRAPSFSIDRRSLWAFDVLVDEGLEYDSSVFPVDHPRYGIPTFKRTPCLVRTSRGKKIREFPLTTLRVLGRNLGASGGGYLRVFPVSVVETAFHRMNRSGHPAVLYIHPWEIDSEQPRLSAGGLRSLAHYRNLSETEDRLRVLLQRFSFTTMGEALLSCTEDEEVEVK